MVDPHNTNADVRVELTPTTSGAQWGDVVGVADSIRRLSDGLSGGSLSQACATLDPVEPEEVETWLAIERGDAQLNRK